MRLPFRPDLPILSLWWPLAASSVLMSAEIPFVNAGIARTPNPELALAGFGLAMSLAFIGEAPIVMLNGAAAALAKNRSTFKRLERFTLCLCVFATSLHFLLTFTPLYEIVVIRWMGVPAAVAAACLPALRLFIFWPAPIGWRRFHQGLLIRLRRTRLISIGTIIRLSVTVSLTLLTIFILRLPGETAGAASVICAVIVESLLVSYWARRLMASEQQAPSLLQSPSVPGRRDHRADDYASPPLLLGDESGRGCRPSASEAVERAPKPAISYGQLLQFYLPLMMVSALSIAAQPLLSTGLANTPFPTESLATWPTIWGLTMLVSALCNPIQETTIAMADGAASLPRVRRFGLGIGLSSAALLALIALTPLADFYFGQLIGLPLALRGFAGPAIRLMVAFPLWMAIEMMLRGVLINRKRTSAVRLAMAANILTLCATIVAGSLLQWGTGVFVAAVAVNLAIVCEIGVLAWQAVPVVQEMRQAMVQV